MAYESAGDYSWKWGLMKSLQPDIIKRGLLAIKRNSDNFTKSQAKLISV